MGSAKRVLVACEFSGTVRDVFARVGWDAWSCDLLPSEYIACERIDNAQRQERLFA